MIDKYTTNRFVALTPFQQPVTYYARVYDDGGLATDEYRAYQLPRARARDLEKKDVPADMLSLFAELLQKQTKVFELWRPVLEAVRMPDPRKDDYVVDARCRGWSIVNVLAGFGENVFTLITVKRLEEAN